MMEWLWALCPRLRCESDAFPRMDLMRFLAALGIVLYHFRMQLTVRDQLAWMDAFNLFVDLFFVISGFIICHVYSQRMRRLQDYTGFIWKRIARLGPLHWATLAVYVAIGLAAARGGIAVNEAAKYDWSCLAPNALMMHATGVCRGLSFNFVSWSISAEMVVYALFPVLLLTARRTWGPFLFAGLCLAALYLLDGSGLRPWWERTFDFGFIRAIPAFAFGIGLYRCREALGRLPLAPWLPWVVLAAFIAGAYLGASKAVLAPLMYLLVLATVAADRNAASSVVQRLAPLGSLTYGIYMLHPLFVTVVFSLLGRRILHLSGWPMDALIGVAVPAVCLAAYLSLFAFEQPARRLLSGRANRGYGPAAAPVLQGAAVNVEDATA